jgi:hypothetical protein
MSLREILLLLRFIAALPDLAPMTDPRRHGERPERRDELRLLT